MSKEVSGQTVQTDESLRDIIEKTLRDAVEMFARQESPWMSYLPESLRRRRGRASSKQILHEVVEILDWTCQAISSSDFTSPQQDFAITTAFMVLSRLRDALYPTSSNTRKKG